MAADAGSPDEGRSAFVPVIVIPEVRDYQRINSELIVRLDEGHPLIRLTGAGGHRLLASRISGRWNAVVEIEGDVGPEIALGLNAPGLTVICRGDAADGAGSGLIAGLLVIQGSAGNAVGYAQRGGTIVVMRDSGHRAGLNRAGGTLALLGAAGRLVGERQSGGAILVDLDKLGPYPGHANRGGRLIPLGSATGTVAPERQEIDRLLARLTELGIPLP